MILIGDVRERLKELPDQSVNCCVTSPPYWGLRDYGTATWDGGDSNCDHQGKPMATKANINRNCGTGNDVKNAEAREFFKEICGKCGAKRTDSQIGLEQTPDQFIAELVSVFREVKRVLRDDGTLWLNIGDSYASFRDGKATPDTTRGESTGTLVDKGKASNRKASTFANTSIKHKDLVGIPWMLAFALRSDGWYLRQDIIWHKPNPMPESVRDRCTKSHEYIFLLTKSPQYFYDHIAVQEDAKTAPGATWKERKAAGATAGNVIVGDGVRNGTQRVVHGKGVTSNLTRQDGKRNKRSVWSVTTRPFKGAHFATFPPALIEPCILAGCPEGGTVLDPFFGAGTTGLVAQRHNRKWIGCELNPEYAAIAQARIESESTLFTLGDINDDA
jgi:DNA modification methylase